MSGEKPKLSIHAEQRTRERLRISSEQLLDMLSRGQGKIIGTSVESQLAHRLLWSPVDEQFFVAILNVISGTVLTILTLNMYCRDYGDNVTEKRIQKVINMMIHSGMAPAALWRPDVPDEYVTVHADFWSKSKSVALGRWKGPIGSVHLAELGKQPEFWSWVTSQITSRGEKLDDVVSVKAKFSGGDLQDVPYAC